MTKSVQTTASVADIDKITGLQSTASEIDAIVNLKNVKDVTTDVANNKLVITYSDDTRIDLNIDTIVTDVNITDFVNRQDW